MTEKKAYIITAVGAGGKTTYLERCAERYLQEHKRAVITTTTHIWKPCGAEGEGCIFRTKDRPDYAGTLQADGKLCAPPPAIWDRLCAEYDAVLVEGDGSHCMPVKIPGAGEPVIPEGTDRIAVIMGRHAVGRRLDTVCHRYDRERLVRAGILPCAGDPGQAVHTGNPAEGAPHSAWLPAAEREIVTESMLAQIADAFYTGPLRERYPDAEVVYVPGGIAPAEGSLPSGPLCAESLPVTAVVMASGFGRRYGGNKLLEEMDGLPLYRHALDHVVAALGRERTVVVTQYAEIIRQVQAMGIRAVMNDQAAEGISASIRFGTRAAGDSTAVIFFAADMPYLPPAEIRMYVRQFLASGRTFGCMETGSAHTMTNPGAFRPDRIVQAGETGQRRSVRRMLLDLAGDRGAMRIMKQYPWDIYRYQIAAEEAADIDVRGSVNPPPAAQSQI